MLLLNKGKRVFPFYVAFPCCYVNVIELSIRTSVIKYISYTTLLFERNVFSFDLLTKRRRNE